MPNLSTSKTPSAPGVAALDMHAAVRPQRPRNRAYQLVEGIGGEIQSRALQPGDKLPTELEIMRSYGGSRTVVREALSKLQAAGIVETRHGIGTFVLEPQLATGFKITPADFATTADVLAVLELRLSLETEAAGLAAQRRSEAQLAELRAALDALAASSDGAGDSVSPDFRFHLAIAHATENRYFVDIMNHLGAAVIPRARINSPRVAMQQPQAYLRRVSREHEAIYESIAQGDAQSARAAMHLHLSNSQERLRRAQAAAQPNEASRAAARLPA